MSPSKTESIRGCCMFLRQPYFIARKPPRLLSFPHPPPSFGPTVPLPPREGGESARRPTDQPSLGGRRRPQKANCLAFSAECLRRLLSQGDREERAVDEGSKSRCMLSININLMQIMNAAAPFQRNFPAVVRYGPCGFGRAPNDFFQNARKTFAFFPSYSMITKTGGEKKYAS